MTTLGLDMAAFGVGMLPIPIIQRENTNKTNNKTGYSVKFRNSEMGNNFSATPQSNTLHLRGLEVAQITVLSFKPAD